MNNGLVKKATKVNEGQEDIILLEEGTRKDNDIKEIVMRSNVIIGFLVVIFIIATGVGLFFFKKTSDDMYRTYIANTQTIVQSKQEIQEANSWERLAINDRKEKLRARYYEIIKYYTIEVPLNQKMSDEQMNASFNAYFDCIYAVNSVNFFLPIAYMKVKTNFNPNFVSNQYQYGIGDLLVYTGKNVASFSTVRDNLMFQVVYSGRTTLQNPVESMKLLVAYMDDLMKTFNNREDWVIFAMLTNTEDVLSKYWNNGDGAIPDNYYKTGDLRDILNFYDAFKNWKIIAN